MIVSHQGQPSYRLENRHAAVLVTVQGGHLNPLFRLPGREVAPYFVNPWWKEPGAAELDDLTRVLRGDFFCFPFGANADPFEGVKYPAHGATANDCWEPVEAGAGDSLALRLPLPGGKGVVEKRIGLGADSPVVYSEHVVRGWSGKIPLGHHAILQFPTGENTGVIDLSPPVAAFTHPTLVEEPANRGYSLLKPGVEFRDPTRVPTVYGDTVDLTRYPQRFGHEDVVQFISDPTRELAWSAVTFPGEGYLYFQLKDPRVLASTLFWRSNGGRHYAAVERPAARGAGAGGGDHLLRPRHQAERGAQSAVAKGYQTCLEIRESAPPAIRVVTGVAAIPAGFAGVRDIRRKDGSTVVIEGKGGEKLEVPCRVDFLAKGF